MVEEDIVQEYIQAMKYHVDHDCLILKDINKIHREAVKYIKEKMRDRDKQHTLNTLNPPTKRLY